MKEYKDLEKKIKEGDLKPVYLIHGKNTYYVNLFTTLFESSVLQEHEKDFNLSILYGKDIANAAQVISECRSYPSFAPKRLVIIKDAKSMKKLSDIADYVKNPSNSTILVISNNSDEIDKNSVLLKSVQKIGQVLKCDEIKNQDVEKWISDYCKEQNIKIGFTEAALLSAYLGNDSQKIVNELQKITPNLAEDRVVTSELIERYIGISKGYNMFEFTKAILENDHVKSYSILHFLVNDKNFNLVFLSNNLYLEFRKLYIYHYSQHLDDNAKSALMGINYYFLKNYKQASRHYTLAKTMEAIKLIHQLNLNSIGVGVKNNKSTIINEFTAKLLSL